MIEAVLMSVAASVAASTIVLGALGFLVRSLIGNLLAKDLKRFEQELEQKALRDIEAYKARLELERLRMQMSCGGIFEKQAQAILELYQGTIELERAASNTFHLVGAGNERRRAF